MKARPWCVRWAQTNYHSKALNIHQASWTQRQSCQKKVSTNNLPAITCRVISARRSSVLISKNSGKKIASTVVNKTAPRWPVTVLILPTRWITSIMQKGMILVSRCNKRPTWHRMLIWRMESPQWQFWRKSGNSHQIREFRIHSHPSIHTTKNLAHTALTTVSIMKSTNKLCPNPTIIKIQASTTQYRRVVPHMILLVTHSILGNTQLNLLKDTKQLSKRRNCSEPIRKSPWLSSCRFYNQPVRIARKRKRLKVMMMDSRGSITSSLSTTTVTRTEMRVKRTSRYKSIRLSWILRFCRISKS